MSALVSIGHIGGSILAGFALGMIVMLIDSWHAQRREQQWIEDAATSLGVAVDDLDNEELLPRLAQFASTRYSGELLRNRLSDLCGVLLIIWGVFGSISQITILSGIVWYTFTDDLAIAIYAWWIIAVQLLFWLSSIPFHFACKLLTGRHPGQAKQARKVLAQLFASDDWQRAQDKICFDEADSQ